MMESHHMIESHHMMKSHHMPLLIEEIHFSYFDKMAFDIYVGTSSYDEMPSYDDTSSYDMIM